MDVHLKAFHVATLRVSQQRREGGGQLLLEVGGVLPCSLLLLETFHHPSYVER